MIKPTLLNGHILVEFEPRPKLSEKLDLVAPERFLIQEADSEGGLDAYAVTTDRRTINPQIVKVIKGNEDVPTGERCFVHYGCYEIAQWLDEKQAIIRSAMVFFMLDPIRPLEGNYLGEEIFIDGDKTDSGIYTTPFAEMKLPCNVRILHVPDPMEQKIKYADVTNKAFDGSNFNYVEVDEHCCWVVPKKKNNSIKVGDEVITIDAAQYTLTYNDKKYIKLRDTEIVAKVVDGETIPIGKYIMVTYDETALSPEIQAENDRKAFSKDFAIKNRLFVPDIDFKPTAPPKHADAVLLSVGSEITGGHLDATIGDKLMVKRNAGVALKDDKWIIKLDDIVLVYGTEEAAQ